MDMSLLISLFALLVSLITFLIEFVYFRKNYKMERYNAFLSFWVEVDDIFIDYPYLHKYFYDNKYVNEIPYNENEKELAICIAEKFRDVFQYSEEISYSIDKKYSKSYYEYMHRIQNTKVYKIANALNPIEYEKTTPIGSLQKDK